MSGIEGAAEQTRGALEGGRASSRGKIPTLGILSLAEDCFDQTLLIFCVRASCDKLLYLK